jgi:hypothetical protein
MPFGNSRPASRSDALEIAELHSGLHRTPRIETHAE